MSNIALPPILCRRCGEPLKDENRACSVCGLSSSKDSSRFESSTNFTITSLVLITMLVAVCMAVFVTAPGLGILMAILSLPPLIRTTLVVWLRKEQGHSTEIGQKLGLFLASSAVTLLVVMTILPTAFLTFCFTCLGLAAVKESFGKPLGADEPILFLISGLVALIVSGGLSYLVFSKWIRNRWQQDTNLAEYRWRHADVDQ